MPGNQTEELALQIGRVPMRLKCATGTLYERAVERYAAFVSSRRSGLPILVNSPRHREAPADFEFKLNGMSLDFSPRAAQFSGVENEYGLDSLLRILLSKLLLPEQGFLLHAATVIRDGKAFVFMGRSGAGKSTVAALSTPGTVLTDEISLLRKMKSGWHAFGTPFWGEFRADGRNISAPVGGIFLLVQSRENRRERISGKEALGEMLGNTLFFSSGRRDCERLLAIQAQCAAVVPIYRLEFRKEETFWEVAA